MTLGHSIRTNVTFAADASAQTHRSKQSALSPLAVRIKPVDNQTEPGLIGSIQRSEVGGRIRGRTLATVDDWAMRDLSSAPVDVAFLGTNEFSAEHGLGDLAGHAIKALQGLAVRQA